MTSERHLQERMGTALYRLSTIERRAIALPESPKLALRLAEDVRKLSGELERTLADMQEVLAENRRLQASAADAERRAQLLFNLVPVPCLLLESTGSIAEANPAAVQLLNISRRHLLGRAFQLYLASDREAFLRRLREPALEDEQPEPWAATLRPRERSPQQVHITTVPDEDGRVLMVIELAEKLSRGVGRMAAPDAPRPGQPAA